MSQHRKHHPREAALYTAEIGRSLAATINDRINEFQPDDWRSLFAFTTRLRACNDDGNLWWARDLHSTETGEMWNGHGRFWQCNLKVCQYCQQTLARRNRNKLRRLLENTRLSTSQSKKFVTMTIENPDLPLLETRAIVNHAWSMFRKREWFKKTIDAGSKSEEFTVTKNGFHYHLHGIWIAKFISYTNLRYEWTTAVDSAFRQRGLELNVATRDGLLSCVAKPLSSTDQSIMEVTKYLTKSSSWREVRGEDLLDIARVKRWPRVFDVFGDWRAKELLGGAADARQAKEDWSIVHTKNIFDGSTDSWRDRADKQDPVEHCEQLSESVNRTTEFRVQQLKYRYGYADFHAIKSDRFDPGFYNAMLRETFAANWKLPKAKPSARAKRAKQTRLKF